MHEAAAGSWQNVNTHEYTPSHVMYLRQADLIQKHELFNGCSASWDTARNETQTLDIEKVQAAIAERWEIVSTSAEPIIKDGTAWTRFGALVWIDDDTLCGISCTGTRVSFEFNSSKFDTKKVEALIEELQEELFIPFEKIEVEKDSFRIKFWTLSPQGAKANQRDLLGPDWEDITHNYEEEVRSQLEQLMSLETWDPSRGRLVLWSGDPGTGKTYALRALAKKLAPWCETSYIVDPEKFFGTGGGYMLDVLTSATNRNPFPYDNEENEPEKWHLVLLEDCGEYLKPEAANTTGQALSRLLNVVDGMVGQGLNIILLITTNEEHGKLHEAVSRPGRCSHLLEFKALSVEDANNWLLAQGSEKTVEKATTLASLYSFLHDTEEAREPVGFGFGG